MRRIWVYAFLFVSASGLFYWLTVENVPWGSATGYVRGRPEWKNQPVINFSDGERAKVLTTLLDQDRAEIRFWQDKLFTISFLFTGLILGVVAFVAKQLPGDVVARRISAAACVILCLFYFTFVDFAEGAIGVNDHDLIGIQFALNLSTKNEYLRGQSIYGDGKPTGHPHVRAIIRFNVVLTITAVALLLFAPLPPVASDPGKQR